MPYPPGRSQLNRRPLSPVAAKTAGRAYTATSQPQPGDYVTILAGAVLP